jgi:hypothetical protein
MATKEETVKERRLIDLTALRVYSLIVAYFDPYYDTILVIDKIAKTLSDDQKLDKIRSCLDNYAREEDQLWCIFKESDLEDIWLKYKNIVGSRSGIRKSGS